MEEVEQVNFSEFLERVANDIRDIQDTFGKDQRLAHYQLGHLAGVLKCKAVEIEDEDEDCEVCCELNKLLNGFKVSKACQNLK